jgi:glutamate synthase (NADPH/NADH) small chain
MADPRGFLRHERSYPDRRPVEERIGDWREVYPDDVGRVLLPIISDQAGRCMDCGIPFCHDGCPLGNLIPEWNDLVHRGDWQTASERLHATNNFPEFTGRLCPAPCESACVLGIGSDPVTIKHVEVAIADRAWDAGYERARQVEWLTGFTVAVVGSGPAGLAAAQQLTRAGHTVVVYERDDDVGGLLRYGIPEFKMEKRFLDRRIRQMRQEGTNFETGVHVGVDISGPEMRSRFDAVVLAIGATVPRDLPVPGRGLAGIHQAMDYLPPANRVALGQQVADQVTAAGRHVVIVGGGDTGVDCLGTAHRQRAASVVQLDIHVRPGDTRPPEHPWPTHPTIFRVAPAQEEGGGRDFAVTTEEFLADDAGRVRGLRVRDAHWEAGRWVPVPGSDREVRADLVLLALGFSGPETDTVVDQLGLALDERGNVARDASYRTGCDGVFVAGDAGRGQSLIVWAIAEGRSAAAAVDAYLSGTTRLPRPVEPSARPLVV